MDLKKVANVVSVLLNLIVVFPIFSQFILFAIFGIQLNTEEFLDYYDEMLLILPIYPPSVVIIGVILPYIFTQLLTTVALRLLLKYISKNE